MLTYSFSKLNVGLSDAELLALFDDNCLDPCSVVGSSNQASNNVSSMSDGSITRNTGLSNALDPQLGNDSSLNLETYLMTSGHSHSLPSDAASANATFVVGPSSEQSGQKSSEVNRPEDNLDDLLSMDMTNFLQLQEESGGAINLDEELTCDFSDLVLEDGASRRTIKADDDHKFLRPLPLSYACLYCPRRFPDKLIWRRHSLRHCKQILRCQQCKLRMRSANAIRKHCTYHHVPMPDWRRTLIMFHDTV